MVTFIAKSDRVDIVENSGRFDSKKKEPTHEASEMTVAAINAAESKIWVLFLIK